MLTQNELKEILDYNKNTGIFKWKVQRSQMKIGDISGHLKANSGYIQIKIYRKNYFAHRLAWLYIYGYFPKNDIDHINHIRNDNRIKNIRDVTKSFNTKNLQLKPKAKSGIQGVYWFEKNKSWRARITVNGKHKTLKQSKDINKVIKARKEAELKYGFH